MTRKLTSDPVVTRSVVPTPEKDGSRLEQTDDRTDHAEAEDEHLRERVTAIEAELGLTTTASQHGVADD